MDKRIEKTKQAIKEAFMELRKIKPLEKISIKELGSSGKPFRSNHQKNNLCKIS